MRKILRYNDLVERGICGSRMTLHRMRKDPAFPVAVEIAGGIGFFEDEIKVWLESRPRRAPSKAAATCAEAF
jgi:predicted DNA-binding transcriptional regulator AlpA